MKLIEDKEHFAIPDDNHICLRCEEEEAEDGNDYCQYCEEIIREQNRDRFIAEETY